ncbi:MAG: cytochrome c oxidase subunit II [Bacteroidetes bacterium]|nr:cytochrome c oxidase subunit II [Bacteroidota bacterium]
MLSFLAVICVVFLLIVIVQISKILESLGVLKGEEEAQESSNKLNGGLLFVFIILSFYLIYWSIKKYSPEFLPESASIHGVWIDQLFNITLLITGVVFILTEFLLFYFAWKYRGNRKKKALHYVDNHRLELLWTVIPAITLTVLVGFGAVRWYEITSQPPDNVTWIEITGRQFEWMPRYPGVDGVFGKRMVEYIDDGTGNKLGIDTTDINSEDDFLPTEIHLVVNQPVAFKIRSRDVLHSFYLPHFRVKMDAVPGIPTQFWFTPTKTSAQMAKDVGKPDFVYELACAELCGASHSNMRLEVFVDTQEEYDEWEKQQTSWYSSFMGLDKEDDADAEQLEEAADQKEDNDEGEEIEITETNGNVEENNVISMLQND